MNAPTIDDLLAENAELHIRVQELTADLDHTKALRIADSLEIGSLNRQIAQLRAARERRGVS